MLHNSLFLLCLSLFIPLYSNAKCFIVTGSQAGDQLGAWYLTEQKAQNPSFECDAIGGPHLEDAGAHLIDHYTTFNLGIGSLWKFFGSIKHYTGKLFEIKKYILEENFDEVVLIDNPPINIFLAGMLKRANPSIHLTYIAPPELWAWRSMLIPYICLEYVDRIITLYPFETLWYEKQGIKTEWLDYPFIENLLVLRSSTKDESIALIIGSRPSEIGTTIPVYSKVIRVLSEHYPHLTFVVPVANTFSVEEIAELFEEQGHISNISFVQEKKEMYRKLSSCILAVTKPGTMSLHLSLLGVPSIITYSLPFISSLLARCFIKTPYIALTNIILGKEVCPELLQDKCTAQTISELALELLDSYKRDDNRYREMLKQFAELRHMLIDGPTHPTTRNAIVFQSS